MRLLAAERRLVGSLFAGLIPSGGGGRFPLGAREAGVVEFFQEHLGFLPPRTRWALRAVVDLVGAVALVHPGGARGLLERFAASRVYALREAVTLLKQVVSMGYFTDERVRRELGLDRGLG